MEGTRDNKNGLWSILLKQKPQLQANSVIQNNKTKKEFTQYVHGLLFSPAKSTLIDAIDRGNFTSWPEVTAKLVRKHLPPSVHTARGHLKQQRKNINSTKKTTILMIS